jgi:hypothetical protein
MRRAYVGIKAEPGYRQSAFASGLRACGYEVAFGPPKSFDPDTVFVSWNRYFENHDFCTKLEKAGGVCLIAENGYVNGRHDGGDYYALAIGGHNGSGRWYVGGPERWDALGVELKPWRAEGDHILVCPNRNFGRPDMIMPANWARDVKARLQRLTKRPVRVRPHPGNDAPKTPLSADLKGAHCVVIWSSSAGVKALIEGIPVISHSPFWICKRSGVRSRLTRTRRAAAVRRSADAYRNAL